MFHSPLGLPPVPVYIGLCFCLSAWLSVSCLSFYVCLSFSLPPRLVLSPSLSLPLCRSLFIHQFAPSPFSFGRSLFVSSVYHVSSLLLPPPPIPQPTIDPNFKTRQHSKRKLQIKGKRDSNRSLKASKHSRGESNTFPSKQCQQVRYGL